VVGIGIGELNEVGLVGRPFAKRGGSSTLRICLPGKLGRSLLLDNDGCRGGRGARPIDVIKRNSVAILQFHPEDDELIGSRVVPKINGVARFGQAVVWDRLEDIKAPAWEGAALVPTNKVRFWVRSPVRASLKVSTPRIVQRCIISSKNPGAVELAGVVPCGHDMW
jgi:hypothetical protein